MVDHCAIFSLHASGFLAVLGFQLQLPSPSCDPLFFSILSSYAASVMLSGLGRYTWRHAYFRFVEETKDTIYIFVALKAARLQKKVKGERS